MRRRRGFFEVVVPVAVVAVGWVCLWPLILAAWASEALAGE
jgi:hypothetical protein